jgi:hypothetical protein
MTDTLTDSLPDTLPDHTTDKKKTRQDAKVTRLDVRLPNDLHATIEAIAQANGEPRHHITGNIILTPTVVKLIRLGVASLSGDYQTLADISTTTGQVSDILTPRMQAVESEVSILKKQISRLEDKLNGLIVSDNLAVVADTIPDALPPIVPDTLSDTLPDIVPDTISSTLPDTLADTLTDTRPDTLADTLPAPGDKQLGKDVKRWLKSLEDEKFRSIVQVAIDEDASNPTIVERLFLAGYGKKGNTEPYPHNLASAMKTALQSRTPNPQPL